MMLRGQIMGVKDIKMPTKKPRLVCYLPNGAPVWNYGADDILDDLCIYLAQPDEANEAATEQPESEALEDDGNDIRKP